MDLETEVVLLKQRVQALEALVHTNQVPAIEAETAAARATAAPMGPGPRFLPPTPVVSARAAPTAPAPAAQHEPAAPHHQMPPPPGPHTQPIGSPHPSTPPPPDLQNVPGPSAPPKPKQPFDFGVEATLRWAGVALVTLAGIFLVSTAVSRGWIGPELQLLGAALGGVGLLVGAVGLAERRRPWALALGCGGAIVLIASALATHEWLDLVGPAPALFLAILVTAASIAVALATKLEGIATVASVVALTATISTWASIGDNAALVWIVAAIAASCGVGLALDWRWIRLTTGWIGAVVLLSYSYESAIGSTTQTLGVAGSLLVAAVLWGGSAYSAHVRAISTTAPNTAKPNPSEEAQTDSSAATSTAIDYRVVALVPGWLWLIVANLLDLSDGATGGLACLIAVVFGALAAVGRPVGRLTSTSTMLGALTLLGVGFAVLLDGPALMVAFTGQAITSYFVGRGLDDEWIKRGGYAAMGIASLLAAFEILLSLEDATFSPGAALATAIVVAVWIGAAALAYLRSEEVEVPFASVFVGAWVGGLGWVAALLNQVPQGQGLISAAWAIAAGAALVVGLQNRLAVVRTAAMLTLGVTLFKLVTIDMAEVDVFWRVGLFFVVGMGLIALGLKVPSLMGPDRGAAEDQSSPHPTEF